MTPSIPDLPFPVDPADQALSRSEENGKNCVRYLGNYMVSEQENYSVILLAMLRLLFQKPLKRAANGFSAIIYTR
ncbi:hypothetical protein NSMM_400209 [Nitrosomonas mobilis]|uniref:Uncharacterized protein n=1 Tax=Nitrosomonas mobilis TaxID=51642 RepID=A0A1G5SGQ5_9PROT|nr:hypothetical protein NSMM_400209 [Nitrosomonas mobilis]